MSDFRGNIAREQIARALAEALLKDPRPIDLHQAKILAGEYLLARSMTKALNGMIRAAKRWAPAPEWEKWPPAAPSPDELEAMRAAGFGRIADWCLAMLSAEVLAEDGPHS
jgi:hypothetical protein